MDTELMCWTGVPAAGRGPDPGVAGWPRGGGGILPGAAGQAGRVRPVPAAASTGETCSCTGTVNIAPGGGRGGGGDSTARRM